tara:strand:+ start:5177 stop:6295 length:1119 start_codon:yes stop_codon:yes gene_type:complete
MALKSKKRIFVLAGESSGDFLGSELIRAIKLKWPDADFTFWGGEEMVSALGDQRPQVNINELSVMGFLEVLRHIPRIIQQEKFLRNFLLDWNPNIVICIDYQTFNARLARWISKIGLRKKGCKVFQIVSPQFWAWRYRRVYELKKHFDAVFPLLPFESKLLETAGVNAPYFGHPVVNRIKNNTLLDDSGWLALLPGSRVQEISRHVPIFLNSAKKIGRPFKWIKPQSIQMSDYLKLLKTYSGEDFQSSEIVKGLNQIEGASLAIVASGTATLEMALKGIPQVVAYKTSWISYFIAKSLIRVKFISLVNLILEKNAVIELIQHHCKPKYLTLELTKLIDNPRSQDDICMDLKSKLDIGMDPMDMIAKYIIKDA